MKHVLVLLIISFLLPNGTIGQNKISIKKSYPTFDAIYKADTENSKEAKFYCFKKSGYVYSFQSKIKSKKIIENCKTQSWLRNNALKGKYFLKVDSIIIFPIQYSPIGEEITTDFFYDGKLDSTSLSISTIGQPTENKFKFTLFYPIPLVFENE